MASDLLVRSIGNSSFGKCYAGRDQGTVLDGSFGVFRQFYRLKTALTGARDGKRRGHYHSAPFVRKASDGRCRQPDTLRSVVSCRRLCPDRRGPVN